MVSTSSHSYRNSFSFILRRLSVDGDEMQQKSGMNRQNIEQISERM